MGARDIALVAQGIFEKSDSIGYDAVFEYKILREMHGGSRVRIFAERFDRKLHADVPIEPIAELWKQLDMHPHTTIVYHYCDGWPLLDDRLLSLTGDVVVRWHNNTPPWFYGATHRRAVDRTVAGFGTILKFIANPAIRFWVNSNFTLDQLRVLGADPARAAVVYPGSRFLEPRQAAAPTAAPDKRRSLKTVGDQPIRLLFVGRVVAHKGHRHVVMFASALQRALDRKVSVVFPGRDDPATTLKADLMTLGESEGVQVLLPGEVAENELLDAYRQADLFVCFSEHEGFGLPVFEAMRVGLPVMVLGRTALRELMKAHPFMLDELDFAKAIAAVGLLADDDTRRDILEIQSALLESYTAQVVAEQLEAAMAGGHGPWLDKLPAAATIESRAGKIRAQIAANEIDTDARPIQPIEISDNFVTVYDIQSYESLLDHRGGIHALARPDSPIGYVTLSHRDFVTSYGTISDDGIAFSAATAIKNPSHAIYGPYEKLARGYFSVDFRLEAERDGDERVELECDVLIDGRQRITKRKIKVKAIHAGPPLRLFFPVIAESALVEFRIRVSRRGNCNVLFKGVTIRNMRKAGAGLRDKRIASWFRLPRFGAFR